MYDYIRVFTDETAAIAACPDAGQHTGEGWSWSTVSVIAGVTLKTGTGEVVPGFAVWITRPSVDDGLAAVSEVELSRALARHSATLGECVTRSAPGFLSAHPVVSISPVMMGSNYPIGG